jgi:hypothetical protein
MPLANREKRKDAREARRLVWAKTFAAAKANPDADADQLFGIVAADLEDTEGFDIGILLQLLITVLPLILKLFNK